MKLINPMGRSLVSRMTGELPTGNLVWVDKVNGNDFSGIRGRADRPFATLTAAKTAAVTGDTIIVLPGIYNENDLAKDQVNWHFINGSIVVYSAADTKAIFEITSNLTFQVTGFGVFDNDTGQANARVLNVTAVAPTIDIQCNDMVCLGACLLFTGSSGSVKVTTYGVISAGSQPACKVTGSATVLLTVQARKLDSGAADTIYMDATAASLVTITATQISSAAGRAIYCGGTTGKMTISCLEIVSSISHGIEFAGGTLVVNNSRIVSDWVNTAARAVLVSGGPTSGAAALRLVRCILVVKPGGTTPPASISGVTSARPVGYYGQCLANVAQGTLITPQISSLLVDANVI